MNMVDSAPAPPSALAEVVMALESMASSGWRVDDGPRVLSIESPPSDSLEHLKSMISVLEPAASDLRILGSIGQHRVVFRSHKGELIVSDLPEATPADLFEDRQQQLAGDAVWSGSAARAGELPFEWVVEGELDLSRLIHPGTSTQELRVVLRVATVAALFESCLLWSSADLVSADNRRRVYIAVDAPRGTINLGSLTFADPTVILEALPGVDTATTSHSGADSTLGLPRPGAFLPATGTSIGDQSARASWKDVIDRCSNLAGFTAWCELASEVTIRETHVDLTFRGFRRTVISVSETIGSTDDVLRLHRWAIGDTSPDRLLAVRQVASLHDADELISGVGDILESAELVFLGLRTEAVAEAVKGHREAQAAAIEAVRQTLKSVQDLTKGASDRTFASLIAIGGVLIARASTDVTVELSRYLLSAVAIFLVALAAWSIGVEGPLAGLTLKHLREDLKRGSPLLTEAQLTDLVGSTTVRATKAKLRITRVTLPVLHTLLAGGALYFAFYLLP